MMQKRENVMVEETEEIKKYDDHKREPLYAGA